MVRDGGQRKQQPALSPGSVCSSDAQPTEEEREVWNQVDLVLQDSESILMGLREYKGASQEIRDVRTLEALQEHLDYPGKPA